jgi:acyl transferase domain-containing protein/NAD(P)-dependent dehydrogenase (short-subunit alcohol dehydrogenase family)/acyl carrier protein
MSVRSNENEPVAVIGLGCRFPGASGPGAFWKLLESRGDAVGTLPVDRTRGQTSVGRHDIRGGFLEHVDRFDGRFFGISPREAERLDPQQRLLLEVTWEALDDAGLVVARLDGSATSVFVGMWINDYEARMFSESGHVDFHMTTGSGRYTASGRLSHLLGLRGPSVTVDTACSSSLVAVHLACQSLWSGEVELSIAAGVNVILQPHITTAYSQSGMLSADGRCKFGDARADGYVRSEGIGVVVLKPLSHARRDRDPIHAVILGSAVNNDGHTGGSLGTPGRAGQEDLLRAAYRRAGVAPNAVQYVEAHGTGTRAGDPVELSALGAVLGRCRAAERPCLVGSVKTNIGHTEGAAGIAGLIKVALSLEHRVIPASLHCETPTPEVAWSDLGVAIPGDAVAWPDAARPVAGVSSFGIGGTNAHVVLGGAPADTAGAGGDEPSKAYLLPLSARSPEALRAMGESHAAHLAHPGPASVRDLCFTAAVRRSHHEHRLAVVGRDREELATRLDALLRTGPASGIVESRPAVRAPRVTFVFPGQGSQWIGMGLGLAAVEPAFRQALERCDRAIAAHAGWSLLEELQAGEPSRLDRIDVVQPALFAIQVALAAQWRAWGVEPDAVVGHSMGEVAAAHVAGALGLDVAAGVICMRSALLRRISGRGAMAVVELSPAEVHERLRGREDRLSIAACNSDRSTVVAGDVAAVDDLIARLEQDGVFCRPVKVDVASHSPQVDPLREDLLRGLAGLVATETQIPMCSTVTGAPIDGAQLVAAYWMRNLRETVQFAAAVRRLRADGCDTFIEISPHPVLLPAIEQGLCLPSLRRQEPERAVMLESLGALYTGGYAVDWTRLYPTGGRCVSLPAYRWQREHFWYPAAPAGTARRLAPGAHPLLDEHIVSSTDPGRHFWQGRLDPGQTPWLLEHRVHGMAVLPASAIVEMALSAAATVFGSGPASVEDVRLEAPLMVNADAPRTVQLVVSTSGPGAATFRLASRGPETGISELWAVHATGGIRSQADIAAGTVVTPFDSSADAVPAARHYEAMSRRGLEYGSAFQGVVSVSRQGRIVVARLRSTDTVNGDAGRYTVHPCLFDAALQGVIAALDGTRAPATATYVPASVDRVVLHRGPVAEGELRCRVAVRDEAADEALVADVLVVDATGRPVAEVSGVRVAPLAREAGAALDRCRFEVQWRRQSTAGSGRPEAPGRWVILADRRGVGEALAHRLTARGARCSLVFSRAGEIEALLGGTGVEPVQGIAYLWGLDAEALRPGTTKPITEAAAVQELVEVVRVLAADGSPTRPRLVLVTAGVQEIAEAPGPVVVEQAPLWGAGAVVGSEHPDLRPSRVDLSVELGGDEIDGLANACLAPDGEGQIALRGRDRYVARLERVAPGSGLAAEAKPVPARSTPFRVYASPLGTLDGLRLRPLAGRKPGPGEIEIEVGAVGLNFMDVMSALGSLPGHPNGVGPIGIECAGRVVAAGPGVESPKPGDEVVAIAFDCLGTHAIADARLAVPRPTGLDHETAATLPIAFLTASYALEDLARMRGGERVLIHAAAGGVGLAAVQLARRAGATVFATAGSPAKHEYLRSLGVEHVLDSRSLAFARDVKTLTGGAGVDIVLNSLAGEAVAAGLSTLAPYGRFVEIGKRDIYQNAPLDLGPFRSNLSYAALDLERLCRERPAVVGGMLVRLMRRVAAGEIQPIPVRVFPIGEVTEAFRYMAEARHIGKIALSLSPEHAAAAPLTATGPAIRPDATYLITGGLGALGLTMARALVSAGARHLALLGRRPPGENARHAIAALEESGAEVVTIEADVAAPGPMAAALDALRRRMPALRGVIHAAGALDDATLLRMKPAQIRAVMAPKATGAWVLHSLTEPDALDFFVLCSSASALLGLAGQANYAGANAFLDALARHRQSLGRPAVSIGWGPWSDIGLAAASRDRGARLESQGLGSLSPEQGTEAFISMLEGHRAHQAVMVFDVDTWSAARGGGPDPFLGALLRPVAARVDESGAALPDVVRAAPAAGRLGMLREHLTARVARILRLEPGRVDPEAPLKSLGLDSLMTLELRNHLEADCGLRLSATLVWNYPTIAALAGYIGAALGLVADPTAPDPGAAADRAAPDDGLSRDQVGVLLDEELARVNRLLESGREQGHE